MNGEGTVDLLILAAGRSSRMGDANKLLARFIGEPLVRRTARIGLACRDRGAVRVVVGHQEDEIRAALSGLAVEWVSNPDYAEGIAASLRHGVAASAGAAGVLVILADQPGLQTADLEALIAAFRADETRPIVAATDAGRRRNPVLIPDWLAPDVRGLTGDTGAAPLLTAHADRMVTVEIGPAASLDVDTPETMAEAGGILPLE